MWLLSVRYRWCFDYEQHDYATAAISHLPHIIAYSLVNLVKSCDDCEGTMKTIAAGGFKDITRIASSSPRHVGKYLSFNQEQILRLIDSFCGELGHMRSAIAASDSKALMEAFYLGKRLPGFPDPSRERHLKAGI